jgi:drug/metabolite transporter (DMT)-like permease
MRLLQQIVAIAAVAFVGSVGVGAAQGHASLTMILGLATAALLVFADAWVIQRSERPEPVEAAGKADATATLSQ